MAFLTKFSACALLTLSLAACSGGGGGSKNYAKSLDNLQEVAGNFARIQNSAPSQTRPNNSEELTAEASSYPESDVREKAARMKQAMRDCRVTQQGNTPDRNQGRPGQPIEINFGMKIDGNCPVSSELIFQMRIAQTSTSASMTGLYKVKLNITDESLADMNDVSAADIRGSFNGTEKGLTGSTKGAITSKKFGNVLVEGTISAVPSGNTAVVDNRMSFTIKGEVTEFVQNVVTENRSGTQKETFQINGKVVPESEFRAAVKKLGFLGGFMSDDAQNSNQNEGSNQPDFPDYDDGNSF